MYNDALHQLARLNSFLDRDIFIDVTSKRNKASGKLNQSSAWYAEAVDRAVIRKLEKIRTLQGLKKSCNKVKEKFAMGNTRNVL